MAQSTRPHALILAGGMSRRMGIDKAQIRIGDTPLALYVARRLDPQVSGVSLNAPTEHPLAAHIRVIPDSRPDRPGPLAGVLAGLRAFSKAGDGPTHLLTTPCDTPFLPTDLVERLTQEAVAGRIVMAASAGRAHPITALWPLSLGDDLERWLEHPDHRRVFDFIARHPSETVEFPMYKGPTGPVDPFFNVNTPEDLAFARSIVERGAP